MKSLAAAALAALLVLAACSGGSPGATPSPTPTITPAPTPTTPPSPVASPTPREGSSQSPTGFDADRAFAHVEALATDIGSRPAGSDAERKAARYLRDQLQGFGYDVELQSFSYETFADAGSSLEALSPSSAGGLSPAVYPLDPSASGAVEGQLVDAGTGETDDFPADTDGKIALIQRGDLLFSEKVANAEAAGAIGVIIYNNQPGLFAGQLSEPSSIPALTMSQEDGSALVEMMQSGPVSARLEVSTENGPQRSQNVVARPPDGTCRVVAGGHYDTVPAGPGANDNASGTATVVETARVMAADGVFDDVCFVLFGAEEVGFIGSERFVDSLDAQGEPPEAMLNYDMVGVGSRWLLAGTPSLTDVAASEADEFGLDHDVPSSASADTGSDHASFINAGIPAVFFHSLFTMIADDPNYHTAEDQAEYVQPNRLAEIGEVGLAMIDTLLTSR